MVDVMFKLFRKVALIRVIIDKDKFKEAKKGSCIIQIHPCLVNNLSEEDRLKINTNLEEITDILRDNIKDVEEL